MSEFSHSLPDLEKDNTNKVVRFLLPSFSSSEGLPLISCLSDSDLQVGMWAETFQLVAQTAEKTQLLPFAIL